MNVSKADVGLLFSLSLFVVLMSFSAPVMGLTDEQATTEDDIPEYNISTDTFDVAGDFPDQPGAPSQGTLTFEENGDNGFGVNQLFITGSADGNLNGHEVVVTNIDGTSTDPVVTVTVNKWDAGVLQWDDTFNLTTEGETQLYQNQSEGLVVEFEAVNITSDYDGNGNARTSADYDVQQTPSDQGLISNLPIIGGVVSGTSGLASMVGWIGSVIFYFFITLGETVLNLVGILLGVTTYLISMMHWMFVTYFAITTGAPGWVAVFMALPGILLFGLLAKFTVVGIKLLPTT